MTYLSLRLHYGHTFREIRKPRDIRFPTDYAKPTVMLEFVT